MSDKQPSLGLTRGRFCISMLGLVGAVSCRASGTPLRPTERRTIPLRPLGTTGEKVSILGMGGSHIAKEGKLSEGESIRLVRHAIDNGITFMDNCWDYNGGQSEERMGKALRDGYRQRVFLMTKLDGRSARAAEEQLQQSLARLQTKVIDLVQVHEVIRASDPERVFSSDGAINALIRAKQQGAVRFIGFTGHKDPSIHLAMLERARLAGFRFDAVQMPLNVMDAHFRSFEQTVLPLLIERGIGVLGMKSMGAGDILRSGVVTPEECLRYALSLPTSVVITGIDSEEVLTQGLRVARQFVAMTGAERQNLLSRTAAAAKTGQYEEFKTANTYDGTARNPQWLEGSRM